MKKAAGDGRGSAKGKHSDRQSAEGEGLGGTSLVDEDLGPLHSASDKGLAAWEEEHRRARLHTVLRVWQDEQAQASILRKFYAKWLLWAILFQIVTMDILAYFLASGAFSGLSDTTTKLIIVESLLQIVGLAMVVVRYLFPNLGAAILELINRL